MEVTITDTDMHEELWAGVALKVDHARFFLEKMSAAITPEPTQHSVALQASGTIVGTEWQRSFYAYLDAFLAMARSVPYVIEACFGHDQSPFMKAWFNARDASEQGRRKAFSAVFKAARDTFGGLLLTDARHISLHRSGYPPVEVSITSPFLGVSHVGNPIKRVPDAVARPLPPGKSDDPSLQWAATLPPVPVEPSWNDFTIDGKPLFPECQAYLKEVEKLVADAQTMATNVHGIAKLSSPL